MDMRSAFEESPLVIEMARQSESGDPYPESEAKRHHFVPKFFLEYFLRDGGSGMLVQLDVKTGRPQAVKPEAAASRTRFYRLTDDDGTEHQRVEYFLSVVEGHASRALRRFHKDPGSLTGPNRATLAIFLALLESRTIGGLDRIADAAETGMRGLVSGHLADKDAFREEYVELFGEQTPEGIEEQRQNIIASLREGRVSFANPKEIAVDLMLKNMMETAQHIYGMDWTLVEAPEGAHFLTSDRCLAMHDPTPVHPWSGNAILSSPNAETTIPINSSRCLRLKPNVAAFEPGDVSIVTAATNKVDEINLRIYGFASEYVFAHSQELATNVRREAKAKPSLAPAPRPCHLIMLIDAEPGDDRLAKEHEARRWPRQIVHEGALHDYVVLDLEGNAVEQSITLSEIGRERAVRRLGTENVFERAEAIHPLTVFESRG